MFLTTHYMDEAEQLADRIAVIAAGRIVAEGKPGTLGGRERMPGQPLADVRALADWALERGVDLPDLDLRRPSLEDVYLELTESATEART